MYGVKKTGNTSYEKGLGVVDIVCNMHSRYHKSLDLLRTVGGSSWCLVWLQISDEYHNLMLACQQLLILCIII